MKIVVLSYSKSEEFTDPEKWLERIAFYTGIWEEMARQHQVSSIEQINFEGQYEQNGVNYHFIRHHKKHVRFPWKMHRKIKELKPDVVMVSGLIFPLQVIQLRMKLGRFVKIILIHQGEKRFSGIKKHLQRLADNCINAYLFTSSEFRKEWTEHGNISDSKIHEVMHGSSIFYPANKAVARTLLSVTASTVFLWVGRLHPNKDPLTVVKGFKSFLHNAPTATLYMIYQSEELLEDIKYSIAGVSNIKLIGRVDHRNLQDWYNAADYIVSGSHYEGGGIAICEAMSCGCIPVLTNIIAFRRMTGPGKCGRLYEPGNVADLFKRLIETTTLDKEAEKEKVLEQFSKELSFEAIARKINALVSK